MAEYKILAMVSTYNGDAFLEKKLENLVGQTRFRDTLVYIYDAASPGREREIVQPFLKYPNILYHRSSARTGLYAAWNHCILDTKSRTDYVATCNVDDSTSPTYFDEAIKLLDARPDVGLVFTPWYVTKDFGQPFPPVSSEGISDPPDDTTCGHFPIWRRCLHDQIGLFDERFKIIGDAEWWGRIRYYNRKNVPGTRITKIPGVHGVYLSRAGDNLYDAKDPNTGTPLHVEEERAIHRLRYE